MKNHYRSKYRGRPPHGYFAFKPGTKVKARSIFGAYPLPEGLGEGDEVEIISFYYGYYKVLKDGRPFEVNQTNVENS